MAGWFERQKRVLPWRDDPSLYRVWISEIMLQQTQVVTVIPYFERFLCAFPTVETLARAPEEEVLKQWAGLGYYSRARNVHRAAKTIAKAGGFPRTHAGWLEIPGVGEYTAGAILSIALHQPEPLVDGNVERVYSRLRMLSRTKSETEFKATVWAMARDAVTRAHADGVDPSVLNQAWMELGATVCTPKQPKCQVCPVSFECRAFQESVVALYPERKKPKEWVTVREKDALILSRDGSRMLMRKRAVGEWREGFWDFPEVEPSSGVGEFLGEVETKHVVTRHKITRATSVWRLYTAEGERRLADLAASQAAAGGALPAKKVSASSKKLTPAAKKKKARVAAQAVADAPRWVSLHAPEVPLAAAPLRVLQAVRERYLA